MAVRRCAARGAAAVALSLWLVAAVACVGYQPCLVVVDRALPADAFARCRSVLGASYQHLLVVDEGAFRLQTDWVAGAEPEVASQRRATVFRDGDAVACIVEVRYLYAGWFDTVPSWSRPRADAALEAELGRALEQALSAGPPAVPSASASASASLPSLGR